MKLIAYILIILGLIDIVKTSKHIINIVKSKNKNKHMILKKNKKLVIDGTIVYFGNCLVVIYCLINLSK